MPVPVVVMLHGGGGTGKAAAEETSWGAKADTEGFLAVFPDALARDPAKRSSFARNPQLWNDGSDRFYADQNAVDDVAFLNAVLDDVGKHFAVDARRVFVTGFSNGASMCFRFGAEAAARIAAIAPVAGASWVDPGTLARPIPMLYITGTADPLNLIAGGVPKLLNGGSEKIRAKPKPPVRDSIRKWAKAVGCPDVPASTSAANGVRTETYGPGRNGTEVVYVSIEGMGHTWAGGKSLLPESMVGKLSERLNATDVIWDFFQKHPMKQQANQAGKGTLDTGRNPSVGSAATSPALAAEPVGQARAIGELVRIASGPITGEERDGVRSFKGIPFAAPPLGDLRWKPPQPILALHPATPRMI
jgi:polyhydroxybutyrate depolymerase